MTGPYASRVTKLIGRIGDKAEIVAEGDAYPAVGLNEEFIDTAPTRKRGWGKAPSPLCW